MCSIVGSYNIQKFKELYDLNAYRGTLTSSFTVIDEDGEIVTLNRFTDPEKLFKIIDNTLFSGDTGCYFLGHSQAPTTQASGIHPAESKTGDMLLWHNGIIKEKGIRTLNEKLGTSYIWDTELILRILEVYGVSGLSQIEGSFACVVYFDAKLFVFRNAISPLFYDDNLNISSTKFPNSKPVPPHKLFRINFKTKTLEETGEAFTTKNNPYLI